MSSPEKRKPGRPQKPIDERMLRILAERQWSVREMAALFSVHPDTLTDRFSELLAESRERGKGKIRDMQWRKMEEGDTKVLLHLSAHHLQEHSHQVFSIARASDEDLVKEVQARLLAQEQKAALQALQLDPPEDDPFLIGDGNDDEP